MFTYEEALEKSIKYFNGEELPAKVFVDKYALRDNEDKILEATPDMMHRRMAKEFARIEKKKFKKPLTEEEIFNLFDRFRWIIPQGSPMFGIGNPYQYVSLGNCFVSDSPGDSYGSILYTDHDIVQIAKRRGGNGADLSNLRPNGFPTKNAARSSSGVVSFMERYSNSVREVGQNGRRGALLLSLSVHHPDVVLFSSIKRDLKKVTGANISIRLTDEFMNAVKKDKEYEIRFPVDYKEKGIKPSISKMVSAKEIWLKIIDNAWHMAEPGLLFWDKIISESPSDCYAEEGMRTLSTNPCGELPLSKNSSCRLMVLNTLSCVDNPYTKDSKINYDKLYQIAGTTQRLMDNLIDLEVECINRILNKIKSDPESIDIKGREFTLWEKIKEDAIKGRRTGTGQTALGDALAAAGIKYGSEEGIKITEKIYKTIKLGAYRSSVDMAKELGSFPIWDYKKEKDNPFLSRIEREDEELYLDMKKHGRRNISLLTTAPAGSVSILTETSSGIEPVFQLSYVRRKKGNPGDKNFKSDFIDQSGDHWMEFTIYHPQLKKWMEINKESDIKKSPWYGCCAEELDWENRVKLQAIANRHVDHSISSTINISENTTKDKIAKIYETAWEEGCKGITVYRKNCRTGVLIDKKPDKDSPLQKTTAPKRPKELPADVYFMAVKGKFLYAVVGLYKGDPYEVFTGLNGEGVNIPKEVIRGKIVKEARGRYYLVTPDKQYHLTNSHTDDNVDALTRMISTSLRHGADIAFIVHQLEKTQGDMFSFGKVISRSLKKYIKDGTKVYGDKCESCNSPNLERKEGCKTCRECGWSACS